MIEKQKRDFDEELDNVLVTKDYYLKLAVLLEDYGFKNKEVIQKLANAHNSGKMDILDFFNYPNFSEENISRIKQYLNVLGLIDAPTGTVLETGRNFQSKTEYCDIPISDFLGENKDRINDAVELLVASPVELSTFLRVILISQSKVNVEASFKLAQELSTSSNISVCSESVIAFGYLQYSIRSNLLVKALQHLHSLLLKDQEDKFVVSCLRSINEICKKDPSLTVNAVESINLCLLKDSITRFEEVARIVWLDREYLPPDWGIIFLKYFSRFSVFDWQKSHSIDYALAALLKGRLGHEVLRMLEQKLIQTYDINFDITSFQDVSEEIWSNKSFDRQELFTRWFQSGDRGLCQAASDIICKHENTPTKVFKIEDNADYYYIARKAVGWLFLKPKLATCYVLSILECCNDSEFDNVIELLFYPLLMNTPKSVETVIKEHLSKLDKRKKRTKALLAVLEKSNDYHHILKQASLNKELHPSTRQREAEGRKRHYENEVMMKNAHEKSFFASLFAGNSKVLLYGNKSVFKQYHSDGKYKRQVMPLGTVTHSVEVPLLHLIDSTGYNRLITLFRYEE